MVRAAVGVLGVVIVAGAAWFLLGREGDPPWVATESTGESREDEALVGLRGAPGSVDEEPLVAPNRPGRIDVRVRQDGEAVAASVVLRRHVFTLTSLATVRRTERTTRPVLREAETDAEGRVAFADLAPHPFVVEARTVEGRSTSEVVSLSVSRPCQEVVLDATPGAHALRGRATWRDGRPYQGEVLGVQGMDAVASTQADASGVFGLEALSEGGLRVVFVLDRGVESNFTVEIPAEGTVDFVVDANLEVHEGVVIDDDTEAAISDASVEVTSMEAGAPWCATRTRTHADGTFSFLAPSLRAALLVDAEGYEPGRNLRFEPDTPSVVRLKRRGVVAGRVVEAGTTRGLGRVPVYAWNWHTFGTKTPLDVTQDDGTFRGQVGPGRGMLYALGNGWVSAKVVTLHDRDVNPLYVDAGPGEIREVVIETVRTGRVAGVLSDASGVPVGGVVVTLDSPPDWKGFRLTRGYGTPEPAVTDREGRFAFDDVIPTFDFVVQARPVEGLPARRDVRIERPGEAVEIQLRVPEGVWQPVRVIERGTGRPIVGAWVHARQASGYEIGAHTNGYGRARVGPLLPSGLSLRVYHPDYLGTPRLAVRSPGTALPAPGPDPEEHVFRLERGAYVAGRVVGLASESSTPPRLGVHTVGAPVERSLGLLGQLILQDEGTFRFGPLPPGPYDVALVEEDVGRDYRLLARWTVDAGQEDLVLDVAEGRPTEEEKRLSIHVEDAEGRPVRAWIRLLDGRRVIVGADFVRDGVFVLKGVEWDGGVWIEVTEAAIEDGTLVGGALHGPVPLRPGEVRIRLEPPRTLEGVVRDPDGRPVEGVLVSVAAVPPNAVPYEISEFVLRGTRTDAEGRFCAEGLGPGPYRLLVKAPLPHALTTPPLLPDGTSDVEVRFERGRTARIRVLDFDGVPIEGADVALHVPFSAGWNRRAKTDAEGVARVEGLHSPSTYVLHVTPPTDRGSSLLDVRRSDWRVEDATFRLAPGRRVEGVVRRNGVPAPQVRIWWRDARGEWRWTQADARGRFGFTVAEGAEVQLRTKQPVYDGEPDEGTTTASPGSLDVLLDA